MTAPTGTDEGKKKRVKYRFKHFGVMLTSPKGRIHLMIDPDKWNDDYQQLIDANGHQLLRAMFALGKKASVTHAG